MIEVCKILTNKYDSRVNLYLEKQQDRPITRGHSLKSVNNRYHYDLRKFSFASIIIVNVKGFRVFRVWLMCGLAAFPIWYI